MKRKLLILSVLVICVATLAAGTLAFFTSDERAHNVITTGKVKITLNEYADKEQTKPFVDQTGVMPGKTIEKYVVISGDQGSASAWVRVKFDINIQLDKNNPKIPQGFTPDTKLVKLTTGEDWVQGTDGWYYCTKPLTAGEKASPALETVTFAPTMGNEYQGAVATVTVKAQAVQTANNGDTVLDALGWPGTDTGVDGTVTG